MNEQQIKKYNHWLGFLTILILSGVLISCGGNQKDSSSEKKSNLSAAPIPKAFEGWFRWRGGLQTGVSLEKNLPSQLEVEGKNYLWSYPVHGGCTPVVVNDRVFLFGYQGEKESLREVLLCLDAASGKKIWEVEFADFISDIVYERYGIGSPAVDPESGQVYLMTSAGLFVCLDWNGKLLWEHSMMEKYARLTFPNGRTGAPVIDGDIVVVRGITANWGRNGPARDRFYGFDKRSGKLVWYAQPGVPPKDSSFSTPVFADWDGRRVFYAGTGCGNVVCVDARTGESIWRYQMSHGGVNSSVVLQGDLLVAVHGKENIDDSTIGRMVALRLPKSIPANAKLPMVLGKEREVWRREMEAFTSSPVLHDGRIYQTVRTGELYCLDLKTGKLFWSQKLSQDQLHASPLWADNKLYVPMFNEHFYVINPKEEKAEILSDVKLDGPCLAAPAVHRGVVYVHSKNRLYAFGKYQDRPIVIEEHVKEEPPGDPVQLQIVPAEFALRPGNEISFKAYAIDKVGKRVREVENLKWEPFIPSTAKVKAKVDASFNEKGVLVAQPSAKLSAGAFKATALGEKGEKLQGTVRGRVVPRLPYEEDFESFTLNQKTGEGEQWSYPPLPWLGARLRWRVLQDPQDPSGGDEKNFVLANTLDRVLFQRSMTFIGDPEMKDYVIEVDVKSDGNRRVMSNVGVVHQRYIIALIGNWKILEVSSNHDRVKVSVPFKWKANQWYRMKTRVVSNSDHSGKIMAKVWERESKEPDQWTIEVPQKQIHLKGAPGIFAFSPQSKKRVYIDNLKITEDK